MSLTDVSQHVPFDGEFSPLTLDYCSVCGNEIRIMVYKHTGLCSIICQKLDSGNITEAPKNIIRQEKP